MSPEGRFQGGEGGNHLVSVGMMFQAEEIASAQKMWEQFCCIGGSAGSEPGAQVRVVGRRESGKSYGAGGRLKDTNQHKVTFYFE